jgi:hypothetical protein
MNEQDALKRIEKADDDRQSYGVQRWGERVNKTLKDMMKEGVEVYDWVTQKAFELYEKAEGNPNNQRKLLDTLAKVTSLKINACTEMMKIAADIGKDERTLDEKIKLIAHTIETPFAKMVLERAAKMKPEDEDDSE